MIEEETKERKCLDLQVQAFKSMENDLKVFGYLFRNMNLNVIL